MATELVTGTSELGLIASSAKCSEQVCAGIAGRDVPDRDAELRSAHDPLYQRPAALW